MLKIEDSRCSGSYTVLTWYNIPESLYLQHHCCQNLKWYMFESAHTICSHPVFMLLVFSRSQITCRMLNPLLWQHMAVTSHRWLHLQKLQVGKFLCFLTCHYIHRLQLPLLRHLRILWGFPIMRVFLPLIPLELLELLHFLNMHHMCLLVPGKGRW